MSQTRVVPVEGPGDLAAALAIREVVFIEEAAIPLEIERDDLDVTAFHVLAMQEGHAIGTGRLVHSDEHPPGERGLWNRIGRMAVLAKHRKSGAGRAILETLEARAHQQSAVGIVLHAQVHAQAFYEKLGYAPFGDVFQEAGIPHIRMWKKL
jgi:predicted GNAT family N-acyltransferase